VNGFPTYPDKHRFDAIVTPEAMLAHRRRGGRLPAIRPPSAAVICLQRGLPQRLRRRVRLRPVGRLMGELYEVRATGGDVVVLTDFGLGAPIVAAQAEELIALGAHRLVSIALCGAVLPGLRSGAAIVADSAIRDEGTSHHYLAPGREIGADAALTGALVDALLTTGLDVRVGRTWSTDAPYRETREEIVTHQTDGVLTVDMEMAALFAVAQARSVAAAGVLVVGDSLAGGEWQPPARLDVMERALARAYLAAVEVLSGP
jgi:uridine phosphorylase